MAFCLNLILQFRIYLLAYLLIYFTRQPRIACGDRTRLEEQHQRSRRGCRDWNGARVYATVLLVVTWISAMRFGALFDGTEQLGAVLFMKLAMIPAALINVLLQTSYYVAIECAQWPFKGIQGHWYIACVVQYMQSA